MSDITRDDLRVTIDIEEIDNGDVMLGDLRKVTDEEFARLARQAGYVKPFHRVEVPLHLSTLDAIDQAKALRALLTDECPNPICDEGQVWPMGEDSYPDDHYTCSDCDGRGWLPKFEVSYLENMPNFIAIPADWLEADDD